jgi:NAD(P)-dependent dehydrogenase (short-subunit alcohol dehydrogenase family)
VADVTLAEIQCVWEVSYLGTVYGMLAAYRRMRPRNRGVIIQVGSALAYRSIPLQAPYRAAKAAVRGFTDSLRCGLIHEASGVSRHGPAAGRQYAPIHLGPVAHVPSSTPGSTGISARGHRRGDLHLERNRRL